MTLRIALALVALLVLGASHWKAYTVGQDNVRLRWEEAKVSDARAAADRAAAWNEQIAKEREHAAKREQNLRRDAAGARDALVGLSHAADEALRAASGSYQACLVTAAAATKLLQQCGSRYSVLAETADRHVSDIQTLSNSWPAP